MEGHDKLVKLLIKSIAEGNPNLMAVINPTKAYDSPLHLAVLHNHLLVVEILLSEHASVSLKNYGSRKTPLQVAIENENELVTTFFNTHSLKYQWNRSLCCTSDVCKKIKN